MTIKSVAFVGLGYIGLPTAIVMANSGLDVIGVDINRKNVDRINSGEVTIIENGLEEALTKALNSGNFRATTEMPEADAYILAVPTPFTDKYECDMRFIYSAAESVAAKLRGGEIVILESTSPPQTTEKMAQRILELRPDLGPDNENTPAEKRVYFAHCPERILPGNALEELVTNDRIVGGSTDRATQLATEVYASFCKGELLGTDARTAEMAKLTENSFRDVNIAFANELSVIADDLDIDVWELIELANHHPRVNILQPGPGVGGHCIAVDPWFIVSAAPETSRLIRMARVINDEKPEWVLDKIRKAVNSRDDMTIGLLGLSFKANIDDLRESPAVSIAERVAEEFSKNTIQVVEPNVAQTPSALQHFSNVKKVDVETAVEEAGVIVLLVDHDEFKSLAGNISESAVIIDTRGQWR